MKKIKIVLDTNILLVSLSESSKYRWIFNLINDERLYLCISNDILLEYKKIINRKTNYEIAHKTIRYLLALPNVLPFQIYFNWNLISVDPDDNKFVDCAVAGNADYIVTNDKHFDILKSIEFPKINIINIDEFKKLF